MRSITVVWVVVGMLLAGLWASAQPATREMTVFLNDQQSFVPGYVMGRIAIGDEKICDFKVLRGGMELLLVGKGSGTTSLTIWDQQKSKRDQVNITVKTRQAEVSVQQLRELVKPFATVDVSWLAGGLVLTGVVSSKDDHSLLDRIAVAARARNLVRLVMPPTSQPPQRVQAARAVSPGRLDPREEGTTSALVVNASPVVNYEIQLIEASSTFRSGSYARGVEPSGPSLYKGTLSAVVGRPSEMFIGGPHVRQAGGAKVSETSGIKLTLTPALPDARGRLQTDVRVETNLPFARETYDPTVWRRGHWDFTASSGEAFGITGMDLLAAPDSTSSPSRLRSVTSTASRVARLPGADLVPGAEYTPVFGSLFSSPSYKKKSTQLLVILRPSLVVAGSGR
jgi:hypothetical protein